jgi:regulator of protease activity HflC (stomatin/prohibitin superfamily)
MDMLFLIPLAIGGLIFLTLVLGSFFTVNTAQVAIITRFGKFLRVAEPGLNWKAPYFDSVSGIVSLRVNQIALTMETKTKDNVFVTIPISVQNRVRPEKAYDAFYKLSDPVAQIKSYVEQVILGHVPSMTLDEVFASQSSIALAVKQELDADMAAFGYEIVNVLVTDIIPDAKVKSAMNDINAAQREQVAASARGEADKILVVKKAEAEAESKALQGQGIANQRKAIVEGLQASNRAVPKSSRRRDLPRCDAAGSGHAVLRHAQVHRRKRQDQHALSGTFAGLGQGSLRPDPRFHAGRAKLDSLKIAARTWKRPAQDLRHRPHSVGHRKSSLNPRSM